MSWNHRLIRAEDGRIFLAEVYYTDSGEPNLYADLSEVFSCEPGEDPERSWKEQFGMYETAIKKKVLEESSFYRELSVEQEQALERGLADAAAGRVSEYSFGRHAIQLRKETFVNSDGETVTFETQELVPDPNGDWMWIGEE